MEIAPARADWRGRRLETSALGLAGIGRVRHEVASHLRRCNCTNIPDAVLVLSELVTNAVLHAGGAEHIVIVCDDEWIRICVHDAGPEEAAPRHEAPVVGGRGLHIVGHLAREWGSTPSDGGKDVWAVLPCTTSAAPAPDDR